jgi:hypothetical protein
MPSLETCSHVLHHGLLQNVGYWVRSLLSLPLASILHLAKLWLARSIQGLWSLKIYLGDLVEHAWMCPHVALVAVALRESLVSKNR